MGELKIITAFDQCIARFGLKVLCKQSFINSRITEVESTGELYKEVGLQEPDLIIINYYFKSNCCLSILPNLIKLRKDLNIFVISPSTELGHSNRVLNAGARGYISGNFDNETLMNAIRSVTEGKIYISQDEFMH